jgi:hypothetical protein
LVLFEVPLPHRDEVGWAEDQRVHIGVLLQDASDSGCHQRFAQPHHIAQQHAPASIERMHCQRDRRRLKVEQHIFEQPGHFEGALPLTRLLAQMVRHLEVHQIGAHQLFTRPTVFDNLRQLVGEVDGAEVVPAVVEPLEQFLGGVLLDDIHIQFALLRQPCQSQVAAADEADERCGGVDALHKVEFRVQGVLEERLDIEFALAQLAGDLAQGALGGVARHAELDLLLETLDEPMQERAARRAVQHCRVAAGAVEQAHLLFGQTVHAHQQAAGAGLVAAWQLLHIGRESVPTPQVEVAHTKRAGDGIMHHLLQAVCQA